MNRVGLFKNLSGKLIALLMLFAVVIIVIVSILYVYDITSSPILFIVLVIVFIFISMLTNELTNRSVTKRFNNKTYPKKYYDVEDINNIKNLLVGSIIKKYEYGSSYLLIKNKIAYKVVIVENSDLYFNKEQTKEKSNSKLDQCSSFYGFEIFLTTTSEDRSKIALYTFQTEKVYYTGFYMEDNKLVQANYERPNENHEENFKNLISLIGAVENECNE